MKIMAAEPKATPANMTGQDVLRVLRSLQVPRAATPYLAYAGADSLDRLVCVEFATGETLRWFVRSTEVTAVPTYPFSNAEARATLGQLPDPNYTGAEVDYTQFKTARTKSEVASLLYTTIKAACAWFEDHGR